MDFGFNKGAFTGPNLIAGNFPALPRNLSKVSAVFVSTLFYTAHLASALAQLRLADGAMWSRGGPRRRVRGPPARRIAGPLTLGYAATTVPTVAKLLESRFTQM